MEQEKSHHAMLTARRQHLVLSTCCRLSGDDKAKGTKISGAKLEIQGASFRKQMYTKMRKRTAPNSTHVGSLCK